MPLARARPATTTIVGSGQSSVKQISRSQGRGRRSPGGSERSRQPTTALAGPRRAHPEQDGTRAPSDAADPTYSRVDLDERAPQTHTGRDSHCPRLDGTPGGPGGRHVRGTVAAAHHAPSRLGQLHRRSGFPGTSGDPWAWPCFPGKQNRICARLYDSWASAVSWRSSRGAFWGAECSQRWLACAGLR